MLSFSWQKVKKMTQDFIKAVFIYIMSWFPAPTPPVVPAKKFGVTVSISYKENRMPESTAPASLALAMDDSQKAFLTLTPGVDSQGNPATLKSVPVWSVADPTVASVQAVGADGTTPITDGLSGWIVSGVPGTTTVKITAEGDVVVGKDPLELDVNVAVSAGDPTSLGATVADPVAK